jgi:outer membrane murein-binding lipoprotein Lpp
MKTDIYTKVVLTIIAVVLTINLLKGTITQAKADSKNYVSVPLNADGTLNVRIKQMPKDVLDVNIETTAVNAFMYAEPIQVKIKE